MSEAERKVWLLPELVAKLFSELDPESVLNLARVVDKDVLKESLTSKVWRKSSVIIVLMKMMIWRWRRSMW